MTAAVLHSDKVSKMEHMVSQAQHLLETVGPIARAKNDLPRLAAAGSKHFAMKLGTFQLNKMDFELQPTFELAGPLHIATSFLQPFVGADFATQTSIVIDQGFGTAGSKVWMCRHRGGTLPGHLKTDICKCTTIHNNAE